MYANSDDIVALATIAGKSALNVVRLSGPQCRNFFQKLTKTTFLPKPNHVYPKYIYNGTENNPFDFASLVYYRAPKSFTGEDSLEVSVHGGFIIANKLIETLISLGARQALPGEFSYRAFSNNKIDLLQAEGISSIVEANNNIDSYFLLNNIKGSLSKALEKIKKNISNLIVAGEHEIDFTEEEMTDTARSDFNMSLLNCQKKIGKILQKSYTTTQEFSGIRVVIVGLPNVGKSSIFNHILGQSRSIVTEEKGTTRDTVEKEVYIGTALVTLIDTAGLRKTNNEAETIGIQKTFKEIVSANIVIVVDDKNPIKIYKELEPNLKKKAVLLVQNKRDLIKKPVDKKSIYSISCKKKSGFSPFLTELLTLCKKEMCVFNAQYLYLLNKRQKNLLTQIYNKISSTTKDHHKTQDLSVCLSNLYIIHDYFKHLIQPSEKEEILHSIFKGFCVGK